MARPPEGQSCIGLIVLTQSFKKVLIHHHVSKWKMAAKEREKACANLEFLPLKLRDRLMPFQREGVDYAIQKNGR